MCVAATGGLPPPARGARKRRQRRRPRPRSTPACAGSTPWPAARTRSDTVYPRLRGEHRAAVAGVVGVGGLPPPARGARGSAGDRGGQERSTPACAGSTRSTGRSPIRCAVYPRLRGEHLAADEVVGFAEGLPPPARGAHDRIKSLEQPERSTPACAGSTKSVKTISTPAAVYPRLRGEHAGATNSDDGTTGLPPPARGARAAAQFGTLGHGSTPACAGSTSWRRPLGLPCWVYPRLRGEHNTVGFLAWIAGGLPPPARGAPDGSRRPSLRCGSTPACAGSTSSEGRPTSWTRVYPRLRGEHSTTRCTTPRTRGLPPPARGAPRLWRGSCTPAWSTPACAGSTQHLR